ncbi:unnamed protein product [Blepharisma stoltei]|uniref:Periodic tryptophan protein 1 homolog n=1 Tax=Blepharisma stoltei TaxID=1481888 RepID=A0AAU9IMW3_9CILI|nr:unnamed protein product [Blepharisma stoltei]
MSVITCLKWVPKGYARSEPLLEEVTMNDIEDIKAAEGEDLNMDTYDQEEAIPVFSNVEYEPQLENIEDEEEEDNKINPDDAIIITGNQKGDFSEVHVFIYVENSGALYVHHDFFLTAYPLALEWLPYNPQTPNEAGNCLAVGSFMPEIELWNLDIIDVLEPIGRLGGVKREKVSEGSSKKRKRTKTYTKGSHHDAVMALDIHPTRKNILASGSADCKVKVWDIIEHECKITLSHHEGKVQSIEWNPTEEKILVSGGLDGSAFVVGVDSPDSSKQIRVPSEIEAVTWNPFNPLEFSLSTEDGFLYTYDARNLGKPLYEVKAHNSQCTIAYSPGVPNLIGTASVDKTVKIWHGEGLRGIAERDMKVDSLFCLEFYKDSPFTLATGGTGGVLAIWDTEENQNVCNSFSRAK